MQPSGDGKPDPFWASGARNEGGLLGHLHDPP